MAHEIENLEPDEIIPRLPHALRVHILSKIPIRDLIRCTAVRKSWRAVIKDQEFINDFNQYVRNSPVEECPPQLILVHGYSVKMEAEGEDVIHGVRGEFYSLHYDDHAFLEHRAQQVASSSSSD